MGQVKLDEKFQVIKGFTVGGKTYRPGGILKGTKLPDSKIRVLLNQRFIAPQSNV